MVKTRFLDESDGGKRVSVVPTYRIYRSSHSCRSTEYSGLVAGEGSTALSHLLDVLRDLQPVGCGAVGGRGGGGCVAVVGCLGSRRHPSVSFQLASVGIRRMLHTESDFRIPFLHLIVFDLIAARSRGCEGLELLGSAGQTVGRGVLLHRHCVRIRCWTVRGLLYI